MVLYSTVKNLPLANFYKREYNIPVPVYTVFEETWFLPNEARTERAAEAMYRIMAFSRRHGGTETGVSDTMEETELQQTRELGLTGTGAIHCLTIIGQVEGHQQLESEVKTTRYEHVMPLLAAIEETPEIRGVLLLLNTVGGDVDAGLGIAELIAGLTKPVASLILGGGHSIGVPLAIAAGRSFIAPSAAVTLHPVRVTGVVLGAPQTYRYFEQMQERVVGFITGHSRIGREKLLEYMMATDALATDMGTVITGAEAVRCGLIDQLGSLRDALSWLHGEIQKG